MLDIPNIVFPKKNTKLFRHSFFSSMFSNIFFFLYHSPLINVGTLAEIGLNGHWMGILWSPLHLTRGGGVVCGQLRTVAKLKKICDMKEGEGEALIKCVCHLNTVIAK